MIYLPVEAQNTSENKTGAEEEKGSCNCLETKQVAQLSQRDRASP